MGRTVWAKLALPSPTLTRAEASWRPAPLGNHGANRPVAEDVGLGLVHGGKPNGWL